MTEQRRMPVTPPNDRPARRKHRKALRAAHAVTLGAFVFAGCPDDETSNPQIQPQWDLGVTQDMPAADMTAADMNAADMHAQDMAAADMAADMSAVDMSAVDMGADMAVADMAVDMSAVDMAADMNVSDMGADMAVADMTIAIDMPITFDMNVTPDMAVACSGELDGVCPAKCSAVNDADCCEQSGGIWAGGCAVPGPFTPPRMPAAALA